MDETPSAEPPAPGVKTSVYCSNCEEDVEPAGKGVCPVCKRFLPENIAALTHGGRRMSLPPERASRRADLRKEVWADLGGIVPPIIAEVGEDFVSACVLRDQLVEHLEAIGPLTVRGTRRAAMDLYLATSARIERLSAMLGAFKDGAPTQARTPADMVGVDAMPSSALHLAQDLLSRIAAGETLTEREQGQLDVLYSAMRGEVLLPPDPPSDAGYIEAARPSTAPASEDCPEATSADAPDLRPAPGAGAPSAKAGAAPACAYCGGPCVGKDHDVYRTFHALGPEEVARRDAEATAEMMKMVGKPLPDWC